MAKRYAISVHDTNRKKQCDLYDSGNPVEGEVIDVEIIKEKNGWKEMSFTLPCFLSSGEENPRRAYIQNEMLVRLIEGDKADWYTIVTPRDVHNGMNREIKVVCEHISAAQKTRNLFGYFDEYNGITTCQELCTAALSGTGWSLKSCDTFYESDGKTEKIRSYKCDEKTGAWTMIQDICELFMAYPIFDGEEQTVTIRQRLNHDGLMEITFGKNTEHIERKRDTSSLVTRLFVQGDYTDYGYVGIDDAADNELHLNFICNFDYYREQGLFTQEHEAALEKYLRVKSQNTRAIWEKMSERLSKERNFGEYVATYPAIFYELKDGQVSRSYEVNDPSEDQIVLHMGDNIAAIQMNGDTCVAYSYVNYLSDGPLPEGTNYLAKFPVTLNGKLMTAENFADTADATIEALDDPSAGEGLREQAEEYRKLARQYMAQGLSIAKEIAVLDEEIADLQQESSRCEDDFVKAMGPMLRDGYWSNSQYIAGQEDALYSDALDISREMAYPQYEWNLEIKDLSFQEGWEAEEFRVNQTQRIYDEEMGLKQYAYVEQQTICPRREWKNSIKISTDELGLSSRSLENILSRITDMAELLKNSASIYRRAAAIGDDGTLTAQILEGMIDISKNRIMSVGSNWYTDDNGNIIFVALDESSAMMLTGMGFMVANGKNASGEWNWRTFGTGDGFTADLITAGFLSAERIRAHSITANHLAADVGESLDLSSNTSIQANVHQNITDALSDIEIGGVNLVENSNIYTLVGVNEDTYWIAADELEPNMTYTLSIRETILVAGTAAGITWKIVNHDDNTVHTSGTLEFTYGKQIVRFTTPILDGNWSLHLYAGISGQTKGVTVQFNKVKLESGSIATSWSSSPDETTNALGQLSTALEGLDEGMDSRVMALINALGLSDKYASAEDFLAALSDIEVIRSQLAQYDSNLTLTFSRLAAAEDGIAQLFSSFVFGDDGGKPYLDMSTSESSIKMRLTNTRLAFVQSGTELAYFSDNKLYVTRLEAVEQISIGTPENGYLDIITTPTGVGQKWRN